MGALPQALEIIFKVQTKKSNEKITRRKNKVLNVENVLFSPLWTPNIFKPHNFYISFSF
jgi:hypothetical protein